MDFLNKLEKKYIPSIHKFRYDQRKARVNQLKQTCLKNPQNLSYEQVRVILRVLKHYKLLNITEQYEAKEKAFMFKAGQYFLYASVMSFSPFLIRQFYSKSFLKKFSIITGIFIGGYGLLMRKPFMELDQYNRKEAQQNIHKFSADLEQEEQESEVSTKKNQKKIRIKNEKQQNVRFI